MKISACWITKNEENNIGLSIDSLSDIVDEMIVVDTGSTDRTVEIAQSMGAKTDYFEWISDFSAAKNHALSLASGDIVFFLDADEWFEPKLTLEDRATMEHLFDTYPQVEVLRIKITHIDKDSKLVQNTGTVDRAFRLQDDIRFFNKIHEVTRKTDGRALGAYLMPDWNLNHSGYSAALKDDKADRNMTMLQEALELSDDDSNRYMQQCYLMREYYRVADYEKACDLLEIILQSPGKLRKCCKQYSDNFVDIIYTAICIAEIMRHRVSRRDIRDKLVTIMQKMYPNYPGTPAFPLCYQLMFDCQEDRLIREFDSIMETVNSMQPSPVTFYKSMESRLYSRVALAMWRRGKKAKAMDYAVSSIVSMEQYNAQTIYILLNCIRGQPIQDTILFLNSIFDISNPVKLDFLVLSLRMEGFKDIYTYYQKKQLDFEFCTKENFLYLLLALNKYEELLEAAKGLINKDNASRVSWHLNLGAICSGSEQFYRDNAEMMTPYAHILDAYFSGEPLETVTEQDKGILMDQYTHIAFIGGMETARRFRNVFRADPRACFMAGAVYCMNNDMHAEALENMHLVDENDFSCYQMIIQCLLATGQYSEAYLHIKRFLEQEHISQELLNMLQVIAENGSEQMQQNAKPLYAKYSSILHEVVDLRDVVNTGIAYNNYNKNKIRALKSLSQVKFSRILEEDAAKPIVEELKTLYGRAAEIYEEEQMYAMAQDCYRWLIAHNIDVASNYMKLAEAYQKLGNIPLAQLLEKQVVKA